MDKKGSTCNILRLSFAVEQLIPATWQECSYKICHFLLGLIFELNLLLINISALRSTPAEVRGGGGRAALSHPAALKSGSKLQPELLGFKIFVSVIEVYFLET